MTGRAGLLPAPLVGRLLAGAALGALLATPCRGSVSPRDTLRLRVEVGASTDVTNELFYEDSFQDSISLGRRLVSSPESRFAGVVSSSLDGTRANGAVEYRLDGELSLGDRIQRGSLGSSWRADLTPDDRLLLTPRVQYLRDRTFGRDLEEWRGSGGGRLRHGFGDGATFADLGVTGEFLRSAGRGADFVLDRNVARIAAGLDRFPLFGPEWRLGYAVAARNFPDSTERDHIEHGWDARLRFGSEGRAWIQVETDGSRRATRRDAPTTRDDFWEAQGAVEGQVRWGTSGSLLVRLGIEGLRYDREDTTRFFSYRVLRARIAPRVERSGWRLGLGPRVEALHSPADPSEEYLETAGFVEFEHLIGGAWWSVVPTAGWRDYAGAESAALAAPSLHSSYAFYEIAALGDQPIPGGMRLRLLATARYEAHVDAAQDARSLYFSLDLRRLF